MQASGGTGMGISPILLFMARVDQFNNFSMNVSEKIEFIS